MRVLCCYYSVSYNFTDRSQASIFNSMIIATVLPLYHLFQLNCKWACRNKRLVAHAGRTGNILWHLTYIIVNAMQNIPIYKFTKSDK